jgi:membrane protease YdiL (CAAX protease family)
MSCFQPQSGPERRRVNCFEAAAIGGSGSITGIAVGTSLLPALGCVWPRPVCVIVGLLAGALLASGVALYLRYSHRSTSHMALMERLFLAASLSPILEESFFRGCLLPVFPQTTGNAGAVVLTALLFAFLHQPTDLAYWVFFTVTGAANGWIRVASGSTMAATLMHATYNLALYFFATF